MVTYLFTLITGIVVVYDRTAEPPKRTEPKQVSARFGSARQILPKLPNLPNLPKLTETSRNLPKLAETTETYRNYRFGSARQYRQFRQVRQFRWVRFGSVSVRLGNFFSPSFGIGSVRQKSVSVVHYTVGTPLLKFLKKISMFFVKKKNKKIRQYCSFS